MHLSTASTTVLPASLFLSVSSHFSCRKTTSSLLDTMNVTGGFGITARGLRTVARAGRRLPLPVPPVIPTLSTGSESPAPLKWAPNSRRTGLLGLKKGMTTVWDEWGKQTPVTIVKIDENAVIRTRFDASASTYMTEVGAGAQPKLHRIPKPQLQHFRRWSAIPKRKLVEFKVSPDAIIPNGVSLHAAHFVPGQYVDVQGISLGKGFQGAMKRWGFAGLKATHGTSVSHRSLGSTGNNQSPGKVFKGKKMAGHMGAKTCTVINLRVMKIDTKENLLYIKGAIPGVDNAPIRIRDSIKMGWYGKLFPKEASIPFPTFMGDVSALPIELVPSAPEKNLDPFVRQRNEREA